MLSEPEKSTVEPSSTELSSAQSSPPPAAEAERLSEEVRASSQPSHEASGAAGAAVAVEPRGEPESLQPAQEAAGAEQGQPEAEASTTEPLEQLIDQYAAPQQASAEGQLVEGRVVAVTELGVVVDIGAKSEGLIPAQEFLDSEVGPRLEPSQAVEVQLLNEEKEGYILLSYQRARRRRAWENIEKSYREHVSLTGQVLDRIKGGLVVDIGIRAFLPASQVDLRPTHDLDAWKGQEITCRVLQMNR